MTDATLLIDLPAAQPSHPARYTDVLLPVMASMLKGRRRILDPFGGTGKVFKLEHWFGALVEIQAIELEPEWAAIDPRTTQGNALALPWGDGYFDAVCTSPTYGNQMAAGLRNPANWARDYDYITYSQKLNRSLSPDNTGSMQWGDKYRKTHVAAWTEARRVLQPGGAFVLNIKNHIRAGVVQPVTEWHIDTLQGLGFRLQRHERINTPSMRYGRNGDKRVEYESVILFTLEGGAA